MSTNKYIAHITKENGKRMEQTLKEHCVKTAVYAAEVMKSLQLYHTGYLAGLLHDMGKATKTFRSYLEASFSGRSFKKSSVNHTFIGVIYLLEHFHNMDSDPWQNISCEIISFAIGSHHGMFDCVDSTGKNGFIYRLEKDRDKLCYEEAVQNYFTEVTTETEVLELFHKSVEEIRKCIMKMQEICSEQESYFQISLLMRMLLSSVMYADRRDTAEFMHQIQEESVVDWERSLNYFKEKMIHTPSPLNTVRDIISDQCFLFARNKPGIYRLTAPTGSGKTLSSLRYSLAHALKYKKKRIIYIIPLLSVLEQNVEVIRNYVPDRVMECHSNIVHEKKEDDRLDGYELLTDNWDNPIIVSTLVQLLNILFSEKSTDIKRMQALNESIVIIDGIQSIPKKLISMFNIAMNFLKEFCHATIILSSATQPCLEKGKYPLIYSTPTDIVTLSAEEEQIFKRAEIINQVTPYGMSMEECALFCSQIMETSHSLLVICNTKKEAAQLYELLKGKIDTFHLSATMCQQHRTDTLCIIKDNLNKIQDHSDKKIICVATQLVEDGVDFSFEAVVRVIAGIDNLTQAAGRCNRNKEYGSMGKVYLIRLKNENLSMLPEVLYAQDSTQKILLNKNDDLISSENINKYYQTYFKLIEKEMEYPLKLNGVSTNMLTVLSINSPFRVSKQPFFMCQSFKEAGEKFHVFEEDTIDVLVPYGKGKEWIQSLDSPDNLKDILEKAKPYTIKLFQYQWERLCSSGDVKTFFDGRISVLSERCYNEKVGFCMI